MLRLSCFCLSVLFSISAAAASAPVSVTEARLHPLYRQVQITGSVTSPRVSRLSSATSGLIKNILVEEGDEVTSGAPLLMLDAELAQLTLQAAKARVQQAERALADARRRLSEAQQLAPQRNIAKSEVLSLKAEVALDESALDQARAEAAHQQGVLQRHKLRAPFTGLISRKLVELGEWITPGQGVFELVATEGLRLDFAVSEDYLGQLQQDTQVLFQLNAAPERQFIGRVDTLVPVTDTGARTFLLRVTTEAAAGILMPGMSATATVNIATHQQGLVVPRDATLRYPDGRMVVWTVDHSGQETRARENLVEPGFVFNGLIEIRKGLNPGDLVVTQGNEALQNGQAVAIVEPVTGEGS